MVSRRVPRPIRLAFVMSAMFALASLAGSCTLWSDYSDGATCSKDEECFRAQGEVCDLAIKECVAGPLPKLPTVVPTPELVTPMSATSASVIEPNDDAQDAMQQVTQVQP